MPHSPEWEAKRLAAVRVASLKRRGIKTGPRPPEVMAKMRQGLKVWRKANPDQVRDMAVRNLPKETSGEKNGNWRGGKTKLARDFATCNSTKIKKWRLKVFARDGFRCKECGSKTRLEGHHIHPLAATTAFAFDRANGVTLCHACHVKTDTYSWKGRKTKRLSKAIVIKTIPHNWQDYDTQGNWRRAADGSLLILISEQADQRKAFLLALHEFVEASLCLDRGISQEGVDHFDMNFTGEGEPGDDPKAPYRKEHRFSCLLEHLLAHEFGMRGYGDVS